MHNRQGNVHQIKHKDPKRAQKKSPDSDTRNIGEKQFQQDKIQQNEQEK